MRFVTYCALAFSCAAATPLATSQERAPAMSAAQSNTSTQGGIPNPTKMSESEAYAGIPKWFLLVESEQARKRSNECKS